MIISHVIALLIFFNQIYDLIEQEEKLIKLWLTSMFKRAFRPSSIEPNKHASCRNCELDIFFVMKSVIRDHATHQWARGSTDKKFHFNIIIIYFYSKKVIGLISSFFTQNILWRRDNNFWHIPKEAGSSKLEVAIHILTVDFRSNVIPCIIESKWRMSKLKGVPRVIPWAASTTKSAWISLSKQWETSIYFNDGKYLWITESKAWWKWEAPWVGNSVSQYITKGIPWKISIKKISIIFPYTILIGCKYL